MSLFSKVSVAAIAALFAVAPAAAQPPADAEPQADPTMGVGSRITVVGAIKDPSAPAAPATAEDENVPELPIVYEDDDQG